MDFAKKVLPADTITEMENQLETIDDTIGKVKILNSNNSKELKQTICEMQILIDIIWEFVSEKDVDKVAKELRYKGL